MKPDVRLTISVSTSDERSNKGDQHKTDCKPESWDHHQRISFSSVTAIYIAANVSLIHIAAGTTPTKKQISPAMEMNPEISPIKKIVNVCPVVMRQLACTASMASILRSTIR